MRKRIAKAVVAAWGLYRQGAAFKTLLESLGLWKYVVAVGAGVVGVVLGFWSGLQPPFQVLLGLGGFAAVLLVAGFAVAFRRVWKQGFQAAPTMAGFSATLVPTLLKTNENNLVGLSFQAWHGGYSRSFPEVGLGNPSWVSIVNNSVALGIRAANVTVRMRFNNDAGTYAVPGMDGAGYGNTERGGLIGHGWQKQLDIDPGDEQSFLFFVSAKNSNVIWACDAMQTPVARLGFGHWLARILAARGKSRTNRFS